MTSIKSRVRSFVRSFAHSPVCSMMLSLHNLRGTVTGSRERMAVDQLLESEKNVEWPCSCNSGDDGDEGKPMLRKESRCVTRISCSFLLTFSYLFVKLNDNK